jgi:hypothetical protein
MLKHTKIYFKYFGYGIDSFIPCEICGTKAVDIHHINGRGKNKDVIQNLMALCRKHHTYAHEGKIDKTVFIERHKMFLKR